MTHPSAHATDTFVPPGSRRRALVAILALLLATMGWALATRADAPSGRYVVDDVKGTVLDKVTGLTWRRADAGTDMTWSNAKAHCDGLELAGQGDWRLPTVKELTTLVDHSRLNPAIDVKAFPGTPSERFWSATSYAPSSGSAWFVSFSYGNSGTDPVSNGYLVRCVR